MRIRAYQEADREGLKEITSAAFDGVSTDQNIERRYGRIRGHDWRWHKARHIDQDIAAHAAGIFVAELEGQVVGYVTTRVNAEAGQGTIAHLAVLPEHHKKGIGRALIDAALAHFREAGLDLVRIGTMEQNVVASRFYPRLGFREVAREITYVLPLRDAQQAGPAEET